MNQSVRAFNETVKMRRFSVRKLRSHRYVAALGIGALLLALACAHIWQRVTVVQLAKDVMRLQSENKELVDLSRKINSEIAALSMAARIEPYAVDSLGLGAVSSDRLFTVITEKKPDRQAPVDQFASLLSAFRRVGDHLPALAPTEAAAETTDSIKFDSLKRRAEKE